MSDLTGSKTKSPVQARKHFIISQRGVYRKLNSCQCFQQLCKNKNSQGSAVYFLWDLIVIFVKPQAHERFEEPKLEAVRENNVELVQDILKELGPLSHRSQAVDELVRILKEPHFQVRRTSQLSPVPFVQIRPHLNSNFSFTISFSVPARNPWFCGVQKLRDPSPEPLFLPRRSPQQPARSTRRRPDGGHSQGLWWAPGKSAL